MRGAIRLRERYVSIAQDGTVVGRGQKVRKRKSICQRRSKWNEVCDVGRSIVAESAGDEKLLLFSRVRTDDWTQNSRHRCPRSRQAGGGGRPRIAYWIVHVTFRGNLWWREMRQVSLILFISEWEKKSSQFFLITFLPLVKPPWIPHPFLQRRLGGRWKRCRRDLLFFEVTETRSPIYSP